MSAAAPNAETTAAPDAGAYAADLAALAWQVEMGAAEAISERPVDRFAAQQSPSAPQPAASAGLPAAPALPSAPVLSAAADPIAGAEALARAAPDLAALRATLAAFDGCALKRGARSLVFADGNPAARVMIVGEAPGREEDERGLPFVGRSGRLLDRMFAAVGLSRRAEAADEALYITNVLPWRPPQNRDPSGDEIAMMIPFLVRHIELARPDVLVPMGGAATRTLLGTTVGITRLRGQWAEWRGIPALPMIHPASLLRDGSRKRLAWADLLALRARLSGGGDGA